VTALRSILEVSDVAKVGAVIVGCGALVLGSTLTVPPVGATAATSSSPTLGCAPRSDTVAPQVVGLRLNPRAVAVRYGSATVRVSARVVDTMAGSAGQAVPGSGARRVHIVVEGERYALEETSLRLVSGSAQDGVWRGRLTIAKNEDPSTWDVAQVTAVDVAGNAAVYPGFGGTKATSPNDTKIQPHWDDSFTVSGHRRPERRVLLAAFRMTPRAVDTVHAPAHVTVSVRLSGPIEPRHTVGVVFDSPHSTIEFSSWLHHRTGRHYTARVRVPRWVGDGEFHPSVFANYFWDSFDSGIVHGEKPRESLQVISQRDATSPKLVGLTVTPTAIDTSRHRERIHVSASLLDSESGVASGGYFLLHGRGGSTVIDLHKRHGNRWSGSAWVPRCVGTSTWRIQGSDFADRAGNFRDYSSRQLRSAGLPGTVHVTSRSGDLTPPRVTNDQGPVTAGHIALHFSESVRGVTSSDLSVYSVGDRGFGDYANPLPIQSLSCANAGQPVDCAHGPVRSARFSVPTVASNRRYDVFANQHSSVPQLTDLVGNSMDWSLSVAHFDETEPVN
jgi:hypothetical protein